MNTFNKIVKSHRFVVTVYLIRIALSNNLSMNEFLLLIFLDNNYTNNFDPSLISKVISLPETTILESFNSLIQKKLISLKPTKDLEGRITEEVDLSNIYDEIETDIITETQEEEKVSIFTAFETEFGRPLSSTEIELIKAWLDNGISEELIIGALKEAKYNGTTSIRYIGNIVYEWNKNKFKTMKDVEEHLKKHDEQPIQQELFDYDWLNENDE